MTSFRKFHSIAARHGEVVPNRMVKQLDGLHVTGRSDSLSDEKQPEPGREKRPTMTELIRGRRPARTWGITWSDGSGRIARTDADDDDKGDAA